MFKVTLVNLADDALSANADLGPSSLGQLTADELTALLETFRKLDPVQNFEAEPHILAETRRERFLIRTGHNKLYLYNARNTAEAALTLTAAEIIAELDGSAATARNLQFVSPSKAPFEEEPSIPVVLEAPPKPVSARTLLILIAVVCALAGYLYFSLVWEPGLNAPPPLAPIADAAELATLRSSVIGVYLTGEKPGQYGIAVLADNRLKLFQINAQAAPSVIYASYKLGRRGAQLCLQTDQPGGAIEVLNRATLRYCGETYHRIP